MTKIYIYLQNISYFLTSIINKINKWVNEMYSYMYVVYPNWLAIIIITDIYAIYCEEYYVLVLLVRFWGQMSCLARFFIFFACFVSTPLFVPLANQVWEL